MNSDDEQDLAAVEALRARGPAWISAEEADVRMDHIETAVQKTSAEDAEDLAAAAEWDALKASGQSVTVTHEEARRRLGLS
ncbi:type II toxin-antitoxin system prevent-host-death family antitoxin [Kribbella sp. NPDC059898]|uniref:type II toxin-antitoxin system prevent-host-death family antitoxin n=1 Tax=Kribbella sp. NPDC059898 TaxID=3346995 RepID=UPI0036466821